MHDRTRCLGFLDAAICERLLAEARGKRFTQHAPGRFGSTGPLRHGESAYIRELTPTGNAVYQDNLADFPVFRSFLDAVFGARDVGKSYWHRLKAGKQIYRHIDCGNYYTRTHRFQLFPRTERGHVALIDGAEEHYPSGTLLAFDPTLPHAYENRSAQDCLFLVFDLFPGDYGIRGQSPIYFGL